MILWHIQCFQLKWYQMLRIKNQECILTYRRIQMELGQQWSLKLWTLSIFHLLTSSKEGHQNCILLCTWKILGKYNFSILTKGSHFSHLFIFTFYLLFIAYLDSNNNHCNMNCKLNNITTCCRFQSLFPFVGIILKTFYVLHYWKIFFTTICF